MAGSKMALSRVKMTLRAKLVGKMALSRVKRVVRAKLMVWEQL